MIVTAGIFIYIDSVNSFPIPKPDDHNYARIKQPEKLWDNYPELGQTPDASIPDEGPLTTPNNIEVVYNPEDNKFEFINPVIELAEPDIGTFKH